MIAIWAFVVDTFYFIVFGVLIWLSKSITLVSSDWNSYLQLWKRRLQWLFKSSTSKGSDDVISDVATQLAHYFKETDWAPSDMAVGLILLKREQKIISRVLEFRTTNPEYIELLDDLYESIVNMSIRRSDKKKTLFDKSLDDITVNVDETRKHSFIELDIGQYNHSVNEPSRQTSSNMLIYNTMQNDSGTDLVLHQEDLSRANSMQGRNSDVQIRDIEDVLRKSRSFSVPNTGIIDSDMIVTEPRCPTTDWRFASYAFNLEPDGNLLKRPDILDVIHFTHYANMAYIELDNEIQKKTDVLVHFSPLNDLYRAPYMVSLDHDWNSIVVAIRGTYSISDLLVDLKLESELLDPSLENPEKYQVHSGFLFTAKNIVNEILSNEVLDQLLMDASNRTSKYNIVVTGHSLGAAVASLVSYFLLKKGYLNVRCYGYSMPGAVVNEHAAALFNEFCISIVAGDDVVSRLNMYSTEILKYDVSRSLEKCDLPKYKIFGSAISNYYWNRTEKRSTLLQRTQNGTLPDNNENSLQESELEKIKKDILSISRKSRFGKRPQLEHLDQIQGSGAIFIPGRILYLEKIRNYEGVFDITQSTVDEGRKKKRGQLSLQRLSQALNNKFKTITHQSIDCKYVYAPRWAVKEEFQEIQISRSMLRDHTIVFGIMKEFESFNPNVPLRSFS